MKRHSVIVLLLATSSWGAPAEAKKELASAQKERLELLMTRGECETVYKETQALKASFPRNPDLLVYEANCRLRQARTLEKTFDSDKYERMFVASGVNTMPPEVMPALYRQKLVVDRKAADVAFKLFSEALALDPQRADLLSGNLAARISIGMVEPAVQLLQQRRADISPEILADVVKAIDDALSVGELDAAAQVVTALTELFPGRAGTLMAAAAVAAARQDNAAELAALDSLTHTSGADAATAIRAATAMMLARRWDDAVSTLVPFASADLRCQFLLALARTRQSPRGALPIWTELEAALAKRGKAADPAAVVVTKHYLKLVRAPTPPSPALRLRSGRSLLEKGLPLPALVEIDSALDSEAGRVEGQRALSNLYRQLGRFAQALTALDAGLKAAGSASGSATAPAEIQADRCAVLFGLGRDQEAWDACEVAKVGGHPDFMSQAIVGLSLGKRSEAIALLQEAARTPGELGERAKARLEGLKP